LATRGAILGRILLAHTAHQKGLDVIERRLENIATTVGRVPDHVLMCIFTMARFECDVPPEVLASVCHRWMAVVHGAYGAPLWSKIDLIVGYQDEAITLAERTIRHLERSRNHPISYNLGVGVDEYVSTDSINLLRSVMGASMSRCTELIVDSFHMFESWFPLDGPLILKKLEIRDSGLNVFEASPALLPEAGCPSLSELRLIIRGCPAEGFVSSVLSNVSQCASITHLHIDVEDAVLEVRDALGSFHDIEHLVWHDSWAMEEADEGEAVALLLPKLERLDLHDHNEHRALSGLSAPMLRCLKLSKYNTDNLAHKTLLSPVRFPNLEALWCSVEGQNMSRIAGVITTHPKLRNIWWRIPVHSLSNCIHTLSSLLSKDALENQPLRPFLHQLDWFSIPVTNIPHIQSSPFAMYAHIAYQLAKFAILRNELPAGCRPQFKICLDAALVGESTEIARVIQKHPDIIFPSVHPLE
jgi:hypothetical protein